MYANFNMMLLFTLVMGFYVARAHIGQWKKHNDVCYFFSSSASTKAWDDASKSCWPYGNLVEINNEAESNYLKSIAAPVIPYWIGLSDKLEKIPYYTWRPSRNDTKNFSDWGYQQPDDRRHNCVFMWKPGSSDIQHWYDGDCNYSYSYICEDPTCKWFSCNKGWDTTAEF